MAIEVEELQRYDGAMKRFTHWLVRTFIPNWQSVRDMTVRSRYGGLEAWASIVMNCLLFVVKLLLGLSLKSVALIADAVHTLSDTGTSIVILVGFRVAKRPADSEHPFGHGRSEAITALIVAVLLVVAGLELLHSAAVRIFHPAVVGTQVRWWVILVLLGTIVAKELMARFARELGVMINSKMLEADFWHHRSDALSTVLVVAVMVGARLGIGAVDGVGGVLVALVVIYSGYKIARDAINPLIGESPEPDFLAKIESVACGLEGVHGVHDVIVHRYGQVNVVSLHIEVLDSEPVGKLHDLSEDVEDAIGNELGCEAVVHLDPLNLHHPRYGEIHGCVAAAVAEDKRITNFHDLRIVGVSSRVNAVFDINLALPVKPGAISDVVGGLRQRLRSSLPGVRVVIKVEPRYAFS